MIRFGTVALSLWLFSSAVASAQIPWSNEKYTHYLDQEDLRVVLRELAIGSGFAISVSDNVVGNVNGVFENTTYLETFLALSKMYGLISYYDGAVLWVSTLDEVKTATISLSELSIKEFEIKLNSLGVLDERLPWRTLEAERVIYLVGPIQFVELISEMALKLDTPKNGNPSLVYSHTDINGVTTFSDKPVRLLSQSSKRKKISNGLNFIGIGY